MPSRRRSRSKNLNNNLSDVQRRLRSLERRPVRTKLAGRVVTKAAIAPNSVSEDEVSFGTAVVVPPGGDIDDVVGQIENPKDGLLVVDTDSGSSKLYSQEDDSYVDITDPVAQTAADDAQQAADDAAADALLAQQAAEDAELAAIAASNAATAAAGVATAAQTSANGKNAIFRQATEPLTQVGGGALQVGDIWFDNTAINGDASGSRPRRYAGPGATTLLRWPYFGLNYLAVTSLDAEKIVVGTLTGITIQTSSSGNRIAMTNTDELHFFGNTGTRIGTIGPFDFGAGNEGLMMFGGASAFDSPVAWAYNDGTNKSMYLSGGGLAASPSISLNNNDTSGVQKIFITGGGSTTADGEITLTAGEAGITINSWTASGGAPDYIIFSNDFVDYGSISISADRINMYGVVKLGGQSISQGSGPPADYTGDDADYNIGAIYFRYT
jgi:hypothetical protein